MARTKAGKMLQSMAEGAARSGQSHQAAASRIMALKNRKGGAKPNAKAPLGQGGRFAALRDKLADKPGVDDPGALAAAIGRAKYGKGRFQKMAAAGKK